MCFVILSMLSIPVISRNWNARTLSGGPVIVVEQAAEAASALDRSAPVGETGIREDEQIANALMISLTVIMCDEFPNRCAKRVFSEQNHPFQTRLLYSANEAFGVAVRMSLQMRRMATLRSDLSE